MNSLKMYKTKSTICRRILITSKTWIWTIATKTEINVWLQAKAKGSGNNYTKLLTPQMSWFRFWMPEIPWEHALWH